MALRQVGARTEGDVYQGLFFWHQAAALLIDTSRVTRVEFEHDMLPKTQHESFAKLVENFLKNV